MKKPSEIKLWDHQKVARSWMDKVPKGYIMYEPGMGKTLIILSYILENNLKALVLCPKTLVQTAWENDLNNFFPDFDDYRCAFANNRQDAFEANPQILITNFEAVNWLTKTEGRGRRMPKMSLIEDYDVLIIDEVTAFKTASSKRSKACKKVAKQFGKIYIMSGTPISKGVEDLWHPVSLLDNGERLGNTLTSFRFNYCVPQPIPGAPRGAVKYVDKPNAVGDASEALADISICRRREDCMDLPDNQLIWVPHTLGGAKRAYEEMKQHAVHALSSGELLTGVNKAVVRNKLLQICSGAVYDTDGNYHVVSDERSKLVAELCNEREHTVVFYIWKHQRQEIIKSLDTMKLSYSFIDGSVSTNDRASIVKDFQNGGKRVILLHPATAAHGITLTKARTVIFATPPADRAEWYEQAIGRIVRGGQKHKTETIQVYAKGTLEKTVYQAIRDKVSVDDTFMNLVKEFND